MTADANGRTNPEPETRGVSWFGWLLLGLLFAGGSGAISTYGDHVAVERAREQRERCETALSIYATETGYPFRFQDKIQDFVLPEPCQGYSP